MMIATYIERKQIHDMALFNNGLLESIFAFSRNIFIYTILDIDKPCT